MDKKSLPELMNKSVSLSDLPLANRVVKKSRNGFDQGSAPPVPHQALAETRGRVLRHVVPVARDLLHLIARRSHAISACCAPSDPCSCSAFASQRGRSAGGYPAILFALAPNQPDAQPASNSSSHKHLSLNRALQCGGGRSRGGGGSTAPRKTFLPAVEPDLTTTVVMARLPCDDVRRLGVF